MPGVIGKAARHLLSEEDRKRVPLVHDLWVDIGASDDADAAAAVQIGDPVVMAAAPVELRGRRLASRALDNRLGALSCSRRLAAPPPATSRPRSSRWRRCARRRRYAGARTATFAAEPDLAITLDVTHTDDYPNSDQARMTGSRALGSGPVDLPRRGRSTRASPSG